MPTQKDKRFNTNFKYGAFERAYGSRMPEDMQDAFGRFRVSDPVTLFDSDMEYDKQPLIWNEDTNGVGALSTHLPNESSIHMEVGTAAGEYVVRQTREYVRYIPGKSQLILATFCFHTTAQVNTKKRVGYFDDRNGIYFEKDGPDLFIVRRSYTTGAVVEERVPQAQWNVDTVDANSGINLLFDSTKTHILVIDLEWLGVGRVRVGFNIDGQTYVVHEFLHANNLTEVYMTSATLPIRYEILNTAEVSAGSSMKQICSTVISEGGSTVTRSYPFLITTGNALTPVTTTPTAILAIRPKTDFKGKLNRVKISNIVANVYAENDSAIVQVYYNATLVGGTWLTVGTESSVEYNITMTGFSNGFEVSNTIVPAATAGNTRVLTSSERSVETQLPFGFDIDGSNPDNYVIVIRSLTGTTNIRANFDWVEVR